MSAAAIKAGKAWVELALKDKTDAGLANVKRKFLRWGMGLAAVGSAITAAAGGILAALSGAAKVFAETGSEIFHMGRTIGVSADELSALGYAAEQSNASLADIGGAFKSLGKFALNVTRGTKTATDALARLGISSQQFLAATPYQRLLLVAKGLATIQDEGLRTGLRLEILGRSSEKLASLLRDGGKELQELVAEAQRMGLVITPEEAKLATALGDAWATVGKQIKQIAFVVGAAVAPMLTAVAKALQPVLAGVIEFIRNNQGLVTGLAIAAVVAFAFGSALVALGGLLMAIGLAMTFVPVALTAIGTALAAVFSPIGLLIAGLVALGVALVAGVAYWLFWTQSGQAAIAALIAWFKPLLDVATLTLRGIWAAIAEGNWQLAGAIMMAALNVAFQSGILGLQTLWEDFKVWLISLFADMFAGVFAQLAAFQQQLVAEINFVREQLGLSAVTGFQAIDNLAAGARVGADAVKAGAAQTRDENLDPGRQAVADAADALSRLVRIAEAARRDSTLPMPTLPDIGSPEFAAAEMTSGGTTAGAFNAAVKGMLRDSADTIQERTAKATERTADAVEGIEREMVDFGEGVDE
jgi:hypothetical protein